MQSHLKLILAICLPAAVLALTMTGTGWWAYNEINFLRKQHARLGAELHAQATANDALKVRLAIAEGQIEASSKDLSQFRATIVRTQRNTYDHEKMLGTIFAIQRSGDSLVAFKRNDSPQAFSVTVTH